VIGVAAAGRGGLVTGFSNYGKTALVAAPGQDVVSNLPGGGFGAWSGTSMAAPIVAGQAALVQEANPGTNTKKVIEIVGRSSTKIRGGHKIDKGLIDILRSLDD
jgi:subtilisin family serine protease